MSIRLKQILYIATAVAAAAAVALYAAFDPATSPFPRCVFLQLTGWKCPGCGSQRALHSLLHGDIAAAWGYNAVLVAAIPIVALMALSQLRRQSMPRLYHALNGRSAIWISFAVLVAWWIFRNIFGR